MAKTKEYYLKLLKTNRRQCLKELEADFPDTPAKQHEALTELKERNRTARTLYEKTQVAGDCEDFIYSLFDETEGQQPKTTQAKNYSSIKGDGNINILGVEGANISINSNNTPQEEKKTSPPKAKSKIHWGNLFTGLGVIAAFLTIGWAVYTFVLSDPPLFTVKHYWLTPNDNTTLNFRIVAANDAAKENATLKLTALDLDEEPIAEGEWHFTLPKDWTDSLRRGKSLKTKFALTCRNCGTSDEKTLSLVGKKQDSLLYSAKKVIKTPKKAAQSTEITVPSAPKMLNLTFIKDGKPCKNTAVELVGDTTEYKTDDEGRITVSPSLLKKGKTTFKILENTITYVGENKIHIQY